ncbi:hypothetical protein H0H81_005677 [Sphagnurus paluster]|uniref:HIT domain-containing protein n=1 Tax=Sphagnurus paluster TaxID=117069 RepID=A0A9P7FZF6_9AGAR|nr:hypothetical protein H0H81_005677 [Sphagnurus paluster]
MTSFIIKDHLNRPQASSWAPDSESNCTFCRIIQNELPAYKVFEDDEVLAILGMQSHILPLRRGHTLIIPKLHCARLSELPPNYAAATGKAVSRVANALTKAVDNTALNVVCNQEYAQAVPHVIVSITYLVACNNEGSVLQVHYHIIPAPTFGTFSDSTSVMKESAQSSKPPPSMKEMHQMEFMSREELDDDEAGALATEIRARL